MKYYQYAEDVLSGKIVADETIKLACKRFLDDLLRDDLEFGLTAKSRKKLKIEKEEESPFEAFGKNEQE